jgi:hypothetical protein
MTRPDSHDVTVVTFLVLVLALWFLVGCSADGPTAGLPNRLAHAQYVPRRGGSGRGSSPVQD